MARPITNKFFAFLFAFLTIALLNIRPSMATSLIPMNLEETIHESGPIFMGHTVNCVSRWGNESKTFMLTDFTFSVDEVLSPGTGISRGQNITLTFWGGLIDGEKQIIADYPYPKADTEYMLMLRPDWQTPNSGMTPITGFHQGLLEVARDDKGTEILQDAAGMHFLYAKDPLDAAALKSMDRTVDYVALAPFKAWLKLNAPVIKAQNIIPEYTKLLLKPGQQADAVKHHQNALLPIKPTTALITKPVDPADFMSANGAENVDTSNWLQVNADPLNQFQTRYSIFTSVSNPPITVNPMGSSNFYYQIDQSMMTRWNHFAGIFQVLATPQNPGWRNGVFDIAGLMSESAFQGIYGGTWGTNTIGYCLLVMTSGGSNFQQSTYTGNIIEGDIILNSAVNWSLNDEACYTNSSTIASIRETFLHELGHMFGLKHNFMDFSIMNYPPGVYRGWTYPYADDVAGLRNTYPSRAITLTEASTHLWNLGSLDSNSTYTLWTDATIPTTITAPGNFNITNFVVQNLGTTNYATINTSWYLSGARTSAGHINVGNLTYNPGLNSGATYNPSTITAPLSVPLNTPLGDYYVEVRTNNTTSPASNVWPFDNYTNWSRQQVHVQALLSSINFANNTATPNSTNTATVSFNGQAPAGLTLNISSSDTDASVPSTVAVPTNATSVSFPVTLGAGSTLYKTITITASLDTVNNVSNSFGFTTRTNGVIWTTSNSGNWADLTWSPHNPGTTDSAILPAYGSGSYYVTHTTGTDVIDSLASDAGLEVLSGILQLNSPSTSTQSYTKNLKISGGTLRANSTLGILKVTNSGSWTLGGLDNNIQLNPVSNSTFVISGSGVKSIANASSFRNQGNTFQTDGQMLLYSSSLFTNDGYLELQNGSMVDTYYGTSSFNNNGTLSKTTTNIYDISAPTNFNNSQIQAHAGVLNLNSTYTVSNSTLQLSGGYVDGLATGTYNGINIGTGTTGALRWKAAQFTGINGATFNFAPNTLQFLSGSINGTTMNNTGNLLVDGVDDKTINGNFTLDNFGTITQKLGNLRVSNQVSLINESGAVYDLQNGALSDIYYANSTFTNHGLLKKTTGTTFPLALPLSQQGGTIDVQGGNLVFTLGGNSTGSGTMTVASGSSLEFAGGAYSFAGTHNASGQGLLNLTGGTIGAPPGSTFTANMSTAGFAIAGGSLTGGGTIKNSGLSSWTIGNITNSTTLQNMGTINLSTTGAKGLSDSSVFDNQGTASQTVGNVVLSNQTNFMNNTSGTFNVSAGAITDLYYNNSFFTNKGLFVKATNGVYDISAPFNFSGTMNIIGGTLNMNNGGVSSGGGTVSMSNNSIANMTSGAFSFSGNYNASGSGAFNLTGGSIAPAAGNTFTFGLSNPGAGSTNGFNIAGGTIYGPGKVKNSNAATFTSGTIDGGYLWNLSHIDISGAGSKLLSNNAVLEDNGTVSHYDGTINMSNYSSIVVDSGSVFSGVTGTIQDIYYNTESFINHGTFTKAGPGQYNMNVQFSLNGGLMNIAGGLLTINNGGTSTGGGSFSLSNGAGVTFTNGNSTYDGNYSYTGNGTINNQSGIIAVTNTHQITSNLSGGGFVNSGGTFAGSGTLVNSQTATFTGGNLDSGLLYKNNGTTTISGSGPMSISNSAKFDNFGTVIHSTSAFNFNNAASLVNEPNAVYEIQQGSIADVYYNTSSITNNGTIKKTGTGNTTIGVLTTSAGTIESDQGILAFSQPLTRVGNGGFKIKFTNGSTYGRLSFTGNIDLNGILRVELAPGFIPAIGSTFTIMNFGSSSGTFTAISGAINGVSYVATYNPTSVVLTVAQGPSVVGDTNNDGCVNDSDLLNIINDFLSTPNVHGHSDVNNDGVVDDSDLLIVINNFLQGC